MRQSERETTLIMARHGETLWNAEARVQGHLDSPLTPEGLAQARGIAQRLSKVEIAAIYSSPVGRARETTALIAAGRGAPVRTRAELRERCYGVLEGLTVEEAASMHGDWLDGWRANRQRLAPPGGETQGELRRRVMAALREIVAAHAGETVAVSTHGGPIKSAVFHILGIPIANWDLTFIANGSITILRGGPEVLRVVTFNDTCHLEGESPGWREVED